MSFRQIFSLFLIVVLTTILTTAALFNIGIPNAFAATLPAQVGGQLQFAATNREEAITKNLEGKAQEALGNVTGDPKDQMMGKAKQAESQIRNAAADVKDQMQFKGRGTGRLK